MNTSVVITTLNEEKSITQLLESLLSQTQKLNEVVIVDGGSIDQTIKIIKEFQNQNKGINLIIKKGASIAQGRNIAIKNSSSQIIAQTDAGCILKKDWLEKITKPFKNKMVDMVAGFYEMVTHSNFQKAARLFLGVMPQNFNKATFLPSGRSMAFRKTTWKKLKGYSEEFKFAGEDTHFNFKALKEKVNIYREPKALVYWQVPKNLKSLIKKFFYYAKGDAQMLKVTHEFNHHSKKIVTIYLRYLFFLLLLPYSMPLFFLYLCYSIYKFRKIEKNWHVRLFIPIIQVVSDFSVMSGFLYGLSERHA